MPVHWIKIDPFSELLVGIEQWMGVKCSCF